MSKVLFVYTSGRERLMRSKEARVLQKLKRGHIVEEGSKEPLTKPEPDESLDGLRQAAEDAGIKIDGRWGAERIKQEIESHVAIHEED